VLAADHPLWTDYVGAFGSIVGILIGITGVLIAGVAVYYAIQSAADAECSARLARRTADASADIANASRATLNAAIEQLRVARIEHERLEADRARRPIVDALIPSEIEARVGEDAPAGTFRIGFTNTGNAPLTEGVLTIMLDPGSTPELTDRWGTPSGQLRDDETIERWPGADGLPRGFDFLVTTVSVRPGVSIVRYVRAKRHGRFPLRVKLFSAELDGGGPWIDVAVEVSTTGQTRIDDLAGEGLSGATAGRCIDLEAESP
jgi:hypothetical protein